MIYVGPRGNGRAGGVVPNGNMGTIDVSTLRAHEGHRVRVRLRDQSEHVGHLRTDLLTEQSISVFLTGEVEGRDAVVYIDQIVALDPA